MGFWEEGCEFFEGEDLREGSWGEEEGGEEG